MKVADQVPFEAMLTLLLPMLTFVPLKVTPELWLIVSPLVKPVPEMVTDVPTAPLVGDSVMPAATWKVADADTPEESVAVTVLEPLEAFGTVKVADQVPLEAMLTLLLPMLTFVPLNVTPELWLIVPPPVKPMPEMVTDVPTTPLVGDSVMAAMGTADTSLEAAESPSTFTASTVK